ncbi:hypothetical protein BKA93DRAFT_48405 [Sparassis latifolia]
MNFVPQLKNHPLRRLMGRTFDGDEHDFSDTERASMRIINDRLYRHKVLHVNYTSYDMRCNQDSINPRTHADVMVLAHDDGDSEDKPLYWYARVIGIYHVNVIWTATESNVTDPEQMDFIWVRWFGSDPDAPAGGFKTRRLPRIGFVDAADPDTFGFLDPNDIIRAVHLIPAFAHGHTSDLLPGPSIARRISDNDEDWQYFYVNL